jgi:VCBS repeat-containing protein
VGGAPPPPANDPPVSGDDVYTTDEDTPLSVVAPGLLGNDSDPNGDPLTASVVNGPTKGSLILNGDGSFTYSPNPNLHGSDSFTYQANDGNGGNDQATVSVTVNPVNDPPSANAGSDQTVTDSNGDGNQQVTLNGTGSSDPDGDTLTYSWSENSVVIGTGPSPTVSLAVDTMTVTVLPPPPTPTTHVGDLDGVATRNPGNRWSARVTVTVHNSTEGPVSGATVSFSVSDGTTRSCITGSQGTCSVSSKLHRLATVNLTFTVTGVTHSSLTYQSGFNHDPESDSNGTSIIVLRPIT